MAPTEPRPASPNLASPHSFPTSFQPLFPTFQVSGYLQKGLVSHRGNPLTCLPSTARGCGTQAGAGKKETPFSSQGLRRICPAQSPEVQRFYPFSRHFTATQRTWLRAAPRTNTLPPAAKATGVPPPSPSQSLSHPAPGELFSPKKGVSLDLGPDPREEACLVESKEEGRPAPSRLSHFHGCVLGSPANRLSERHPKVPPRGLMTQGSVRSAEQLQGHRETWRWEWASRALECG